MTWVGSDYVRLRLRFKKGRVGWGQDGDLKLGQKTQVQKKCKKKKGRQKKEERKKKEDDFEYPDIQHRARYIDS